MPATTDEEEPSAVRPDPNRPWFWYYPGKKVNHAKPQGIREMRHQRWTVTCANPLACAPSAVLALTSSK